MVAFDQVSKEHAYNEGEGDRSLTYWQKIIKIFLKRNMPNKTRLFQQIVPAYVKRLKSFLFDQLKKMKVKKKMKNKIKETSLLFMASGLIGVIVGTIDTIFGRGLLWLSTFRQAHFLLLIIFLAPVGVVFTYFFLKYGKNSVQGMGLIFQVGHNEADTIPKRIVPFTILGTWLTHLFGGSAGREGVAVQVGATVSYWFRRFFPKQEASRFIVIGMAAGFSGLFETPIAATFFAMEVLVTGRLRYDVLLPTFLAALTAFFTSKILGLEKFSVPLNVSLELTPSFWFKLLLFGVLFGWTGRLFARLLRKGKQFVEKIIPDPLKRIGMIGLFVSLLLLLFFKGRYSGLGTNLISSSFAGEPIYWYDWFLKLVLTVLTISAGFLGGEVTPLFAIGSSLGVLLGTWFNFPIPLAAALGYASVFASATNTLIGPALIGAEVFGFTYFPFFLLVCGLAFSCNGNESIYGKQKIVDDQFTR